MGNICRSPAGENILRNLIEQNGHRRSIECDSAGTIGYHLGNPPDRRMLDTLRRRGIEATGAARRFDVEDFERFDLILAMDDDNLADLLAAAETEVHRAKVRRFVDFCEHYDESEVPDPYYGGEDGFKFVVELIEDGCRGLLAHLATRTR